MAAQSKQPSKELIEGVWLGISHQTVTVTSCRIDGTFSGTYFTPSFNIRSSFAGTWTLEKDILTFIYEEFDSPKFKVPMEDRNKVEVLSDDSIFLQTLPAGVSITLNRVNFTEHWSKKKSNLKPRNAPTINQLLSLSSDDLINSNCLDTWIFDQIASSKETLWDDKMVDALKNKVPKKAGFYFAISQFEGLWGNGGMQHVLLRYEIEQTQYLLDLTEQAYSYFGCPELSILVKELAKKTITWMKEVNFLNEVGSPIEKFQPIWDEVDKYDDIYDQLSEKEANWYDALLADIKANPEQYTTVKKID